MAGRAAKRLLDRGLSIRLVSTSLGKLGSSGDLGGDPLVRLKLEGMNGRLVLNEGSCLVDVASGQLHLDVFESRRSVSEPQVLRLSTNPRNKTPFVEKESLSELAEHAKSAEGIEDWETAAQAYRAILRHQPEDVSAIVNLGNCHYNLGEYSVSIEIYKAAVQIRSDCAEAWYNLGNVLDATEQYESAVSAFQTAIALSSERFETHFNLALTYEKMGDRQQARAHWLAVLNLSDDTVAHATAAIFLEADGELEC